MQVSADLITPSSGTNVGLQTSDSCINLLRIQGREEIALL